MKIRVSLIIIIVFALLDECFLYGCSPSSSFHKMTDPAVPEEAPYESTLSEKEASTRDTSTGLEDDSEAGPLVTEFDSADYASLPPIDDDKELDEIRQTYALEELTNYYGDAGDQESAKYVYNGFKYISITEANEAFPMEILRSGQYTVYRVTEGGFFFVFFTRQYMIEEMTDEDWMDDPWGNWDEHPDYAVAYSVYLFSLPEAEDFSVIEPGKSTGRDVLDLNTCTAFGLYLSSCAFSHTLLADGNLLQIIYSYTDNHNTDDLYQKIIVEIIQVIRPGTPTDFPGNDYSSLSWFASILSKDVEVVVQSSQ